jgi:glucose/arabinose dehydrogenase
VARLALLTAVALLALGGVARGEALVPVQGSLSAPMYVTAPTDDTRVFVVQRAGAIRIVKDGVVQPTPFLTVPDVATNVERGLSSMAFAPDYTTSGVFYVFTTFSDPGQPDDGQIRIVEYRRSSTDPDQAAPSSARLVLARNHTDGNHYGGQLLFGPDGYLYITMGDGGTGGANGQATNTTLGKVLRIDPRKQPGGEPYGIPPDNPFAGDAPCDPGDGTAPCPEIYAYGFRNPFRASFDPPTGELIVGDVGQDTWEEVDRAQLGDNYGWGECEGAFVRGSTTDPCTIAQTPPFFAYTHDEGCAVIGGYVVHDPRLPALDGRYLYGDFCASDLRTLDLAKQGGDPRPAGLELAAPLILTSFGVDAQGCVYVAAGDSVYRIAAAAGDPFGCPGPPAGGGSGEQGSSGGTGGRSSSTTAGAGPAPSPPLLADVTAPVVRLGTTRAQRVRRDVRVGATCDEPCDLLATGVLRFSSGAAASRRLRPARAHGDNGARVTLRLRLSARQRSRAHRVLRGGGRVSARVTLTARDTAGNARRRTVRIPLR